MASGDVGWNVASLQAVGFSLVTSSAPPSATPSATGANQSFQKLNRSSDFRFLLAPTNTEDDTIFSHS